MHQQIREYSRSLVHGLFTYSSFQSSLMQRQLAFILARAQVPPEWVQKSPSGDDSTESEGLSEDMIDCLGNIKLSEHFRAFGKELAVEEAKSLEDIYKSHLEHSRKWLQTQIQRDRNLTLNRSV